MDPQPSAKPVVTEAAPVISSGIIPRIRGGFTALKALHEREKNRIRKEISQIPGLMALLMKPRNGLRWTREERQELRAKLRGLSRLSIYLVMAALPFTTLTLPAVAWWLDRRQRKRDP